MKRTVIAIAVVLLVLGLSTGCGGVLRGSGNLKTEEHDFRDFTSIDISSAFEFEITRSDSFLVKITADDNVFDKVQVTQEGNTLKIGLKPVVPIGHVTLKAAITLPQLNTLLVSGACRGAISDFRSANNFKLTVSGASIVTGDAVAGDADFDISGASRLQLEGSANRMSAKVSGASRLNLGGFTVNNANVSLSGASNGTVNCKDRLDADLSGASKLSYIGEPTMGNINTSGASTISKK